MLRQEDARVVEAGIVHERFEDGGGVAWTWNVDLMAFAVVSEGQAHALFWVFLESRKIRTVSFQGFYLDVKLAMYEWFGICFDLWDVGAGLVGGDIAHEAREVGSYAFDGGIGALVWRRSIALERNQLDRTAGDIADGDGFGGHDADASFCRPEEGHRLKK